MISKYQFVKDDCILQILFYSEKIVRAIYSREKTELCGSMIVTASVPSAADISVQAEEHEQGYMLSTSCLKVFVDEDAGDGYGYENGEYSEMTIRYCDASGDISEEFHGDSRFRHEVTYRVIKRT